MQDGNTLSGNVISGNTRLIAHVGYPTHAFKSPQIYNPYFARAGIDAVVVPMACRAEDYAAFLRPLFALENVCGALVTMPHKIATVALLDEASTAVRIAGSCNAVRRGPDGRLQGDMFDGEGFVRGMRRKGVKLEGARAFIAGSGGVGCAIAAALAAAGVAAIGLYDSRVQAAASLAERLAAFYPKLDVSTGSADPAGFDLVVNATPMGMDPGDPLPIDVSRIAPQAFVGEVVMKNEKTAFLTAAAARGCRIQVGTDMLFEQIPAYLEYFGLPVTTPGTLRELAQIRY